MNEINHSNYLDFPMNKYIVFIDSIGLRSRRAAQMLLMEGYMTLYVEGGYDLLMPKLEELNLF
jgi:rhodanese-related sulfurtransferase